MLNHNRLLQKYFLQGIFESMILSEFVLLGLRDRGIISILILVDLIPDEFKVLFQIFKG